MQLSDALIIAPENARARSALMEHLTGLEQAAGHLGFVHLESAVAEMVARLQRESFSTEALDAVRALAGRYPALASIRAGSGTHVVGHDLQRPSRAEAGLRGRIVLVVVEEAPVRWSYVGLLRDAGARVVEARDGVEALELVERDAPDLVLADVDLPRLDGLGLCAAIRRDRALDAVPVVLLSSRGGRPPWALAEAGSGSRGLVDALLEVLRIPRAPQGEASLGAEIDDERTNHSEMSGQVEEPDAEPAKRTEARRASPFITDPLERENIRAQSAVAMHREPANRAPRSSYPIWRLNLGPGAPAAALSSGFDAQLHIISRVLGIGFIALVVGTVLILVRSQWLSPRSEVSSSTVAPPVQETQVERMVIEVPAAMPEGPQGARGLHAFSGALRPGVNPALHVGAAQGVLALEGPSTIRAEIDGFDRGPLPIELALDEGRHVVRYRIGARATVRFYTVESGATRVLRVITLPGGLIDAR